MPQYVLKLDDKVKIEGESTIPGYEKQIDVSFAGLDIQMPMISDKTSNSRTTGRSELGPLVVVTPVNKSFPKFVEACAKGSNLGEIKLCMLRVGEGKVEKLLELTLGDTYVQATHLLPEYDNVSDKANKHGERGIPWVKTDFNYQKISVTYYEFQGDGSSKGAVSCEGLTGLGG